MNEQPSYLIMEGQAQGPPIHHYTTTDEDLAEDYITTRRQAHALAGVPECLWYYTRA